MQEEEGAPTLVDAPAEALEAIFAHLDLRDRVSAEGVCKRFQHVLNSSTTLWADVTFESTIDERLVTAAQKFLSWLAHGKSAGVRQMTIILRDKEDEEEGGGEDNLGRAWIFLFAALAVCPRLDTLCFTTDAALPAGPWLRSLHSLQTVEISAADTFLPALAPLRKLTCLDLSDSDNVVLISLPASLEDLRLHGCGLSEVPDCLSSLKLLGGLTLGNNHLSSANANLDVLSHLTALTRLSMDNCGLEAVPPSLSTLTRLRSLCLDSLGAPTDQLGAMLAPLQQLTWLSLSACNLRRLPPQLHKLSILRRLYLDGNELESLTSNDADVAGAGAGASLACCASLEALSLSLGAFMRCLWELPGYELLRTVFLIRNGAEDLAREDVAEVVGAFTRMQRPPKLVYVFSDQEDFVEEEGGEGGEGAVPEPRHLVRLLVRLGKVLPGGVDAVEYDDADWGYS